MYEPNTVGTQVYTPDGYRLTITLSIKTTIEAACADLMASVSKLGYTPNMAGAAADEDTGDVAYVLRREKQNKDNTTTPIIAMYLDNELMTFKWVHMYLNTDDQINEFEQHAGMKLSDIPLYEGGDYPQKGHKKIVPVKTPFRAVRTKEPYKGGDGEIKEKNVFVRYLPPIPTSGQPTKPVIVDKPQPTAPSNGSTPTQILKNLVGKAAWWPIIKQDVDVVFAHKHEQHIINSIKVLQDDGMNMETVTGDKVKAALLERQEAKQEVS